MTHSCKKPLIKDAINLKSAMANQLRSLGFEVHDHGRMLYATMQQDKLLLQLNYFAKHRSVTCQLSGLGMYTQLFGEYKVSAPEELSFLVVANSTIAKSFPQLNAHKIK